MPEEKELPERCRHVLPDDYDEGRRAQSGKVYNVLRLHKKGLVCEPGTGTEEILPFEECMDEHGHQYLEF